MEIKDNQQQSLSSNMEILKKIKSNLREIVSKHVFEFEQERAIIIPVDENGVCLYDDAYSVEATGHIKPGGVYYILQKPIKYVPIDIKLDDLNVQRLVGNDVESSDSK